MSDETDKARREIQRLMKGRNIPIFALNAIPGYFDWNI